MPHSISDPLERLENGYARRLLRVDLTNLDFAVEAIPHRTLRQYIGAKGLGARLLVDNFPAGADSLGPHNPLIIAAGAFQGSTIGSAGRAVVVTRSPLTGIFLDTYFGGDFGHVLKQAGFDALLLTGTANRPVTVHVTPDGAEFARADKLWGRTTGECEGSIRKERPGSRVLSIGPAGERLVPIACAISSYRRAAGRGGVGAVMGAKKLKAVTVEGHIPMRPAHDEQYKKLIRRFNTTAMDGKRSGDPFFTYGTLRSPEYANSTDRLPTRNYQAAQFEGIGSLTGEAVHERFDIRSEPCCKPCILACAGQVAEGKEEKKEKKGKEIGKNKEKEEGKEKGADRPEYETIGLLGSNLGIADPGSVMEYGQLCNDLGLDTISTGGVIGFALECAEKGLLDLPYRFGDAAAARELIPLIASREGVGEILAQGVRQASREIGGESHRWAVHVKGLEVPAWDPRGKLTNGMAYATADIGASHLREWVLTSKIPDEPAAGMMDVLIASQNEKVARDCYIACTFAWDHLGVDGARELFNAITGFGLTADDIVTAGERIWSLTRAFNNTLGIDRSHDTLSHRHLHDPLPTGPAKGCTAFVSTEDQQACLDSYYELRGWDENGVVPPERLRELGIDSR